MSEAVERLLIYAIYAGAAMHKFGRSLPPNENVLEMANFLYGLRDVLAPITKEPPNPLQLQVGKKYRSKDGELVAIDDRWYFEGGHLFGVHTFYRSRTGIVFTESGHRVRWSEKDRPIQLVEEVAE